jgi:hypothetical protein
MLTANRDRGKARAGRPAPRVPNGSAGLPAAGRRSATTPADNTDHSRDRRAPSKSSRYSARVATFVARLHSTLPTPAGSTAFALPAHCRRYKARSIVQACGVQRLHEGVLEELAVALAVAGLHSNCVLTSPGLKADDWVQFARVPFRPATAVFDREAHLQTFLLGAIGSFGPLKNLHLIRKEYRLKTGGRIDLLCEEVRRDGRGKLVAIELKKQSDDRAATQIVSYLRDLRDEPIADGRLGIRGVVITGRRDEIGAQLARAHPDLDIKWLQYVVSLEPVI